MPRDRSQGKLIRAMRQALFTEMGLDSSALRELMLQEMRGLINKRIDSIIGKTTFFDSIFQQILAHPSLSREELKEYVWRAAADHVVRNMGDELILSVKDREWLLSELMNRMTGEITIGLAGKKKSKKD